MPEPDAPDLQVTSFIGIHALNGQNAAVGLRVGFRCPTRRDFYLGPEVIVAPAGQSGIVYTLLTAEQQISLARDGRITGGVVAFMGVGFPENLPGVGDQAFAFGAEFFVARRLDELTRLRILARIGLLSGRVHAMGGLGVAFTI